MHLPRWSIVVLAVAVTGAMIAAAGVWGAMRAPGVIAYAVDHPLWPATAAPLRIVQLSDTHACSPFMSTDRLEGIVARVNALRPDLVVLTGDYVGDTTFGCTPISAEAAVRPFGALAARLGVYAVLGNHDHGVGAQSIKAALGAAGARVLTNEHADAGPLTLVGVDDEFTGRADLGRAMRGVATGRPLVLLSHGPDLFPHVDERVVVTLAGHTHGGQIALPLIGPLATASRHGRRYARGHIVENGRHLIVSAGLGTSLLPMRIGVAPEVVLVTIR